MQHVDYTRRSYERRAGHYDENHSRSATSRMWNDHDVEILDALLPRDSTLLEVACGTGRIMLPIADTGRQVVGVDLADSMLREALAKGRRVGASCRVIRANSAQLPFPDHAFDGLYAVRFLNLFHLDDLPPLCTELQRVVRPGGTLVIHVSNALYGAGLSILRHRRGTYSKHAIWPGQITRLFPGCRVSRSKGTYLPGEGFALSRLPKVLSDRMRRGVSSRLHLFTHTRFVELTKSLS